MSGKATEPYFVEVDTNGCSKCKAGRTYTVIGPDGYGIGETWERYEDAAKKADELSDAFEFGRLAAYPAPKKGAKAQSPATQLRHLKREVKAHNARIADILRELDQRRLIGAMLSNICYNGKESDRIPEDFRRSMRSAVEAWDGIKRAKS